MLSDWLLSFFLSFIAKNTDIIWMFKEVQIMTGSPMTQQKYNQQMSPVQAVVGVVDAEPWEVIRSGKKSSAA